MPGSSFYTKIVFGLLGFIGALVLPIEVARTLIFGHIVCVDLSRDTGKTDVILPRVTDFIVRRPSGDVEYSLSYVSTDEELNKAMPLHTQPGAPSDLSPRVVQDVASPFVVLRFHTRPDGSRARLEVVVPGEIPGLNKLDVLKVRSGC
jgi:hypothetical protein